MDDLKAAHEKYINAINSRDVATAAESFHDSALGFFPESAFPVDAKGMTTAQMKLAWQNIFADNESFIVTLINPVYRVIGDTGIVCGNGSTVSKPKDGPRQTRNNRGMSIYTKSNGKWLLVSFHVSPIPSGN